MLDPVDWWFPDRGYQRFWFRPTQEQDKVIYCKYNERLLDPKISDDIDQSNPVSVLSEILIFDQFSRQAKRISPDIDQIMCDRIAFDLAEIFVGLDLTEMPLERRLFGLLPFRHTKDPDQIKRALVMAESYSNDELTKQEKGHLRRFIRASKASLSLSRNNKN